MVDSIKKRVRKFSTGKWGWELEFPSNTTKRNRKTKSGFKTKREAEEDAVRALKIYENNPNYINTSDMKYSQVLDLWYNEYCLINHKENTCISYKKKFPKIKKALGNLNVTKITTLDVQKFINQLARERVSRNSIVCYKGMITNSLDYAIVTLNIISENKAKNAKLPAKRGELSQMGNSHPNVLLKQTEVERILKRFHEGTTAHIPLVMCYRLGLRRGEAFGVVWEDIDFTNEVIHIRRQLQYSEVKKEWYCTKPKYESERVIPLDAKTLDLLKRTKKLQAANREAFKKRYNEYYFDKNLNISIDDKSKGMTPANFVNVREDGALITSNICMHITEVVKNELGIKDFTMHSLRHTNSTLLTQNGVDIKAVQERLGHKNINETLNIYTHCSQEMIDKSRIIANDIFK